MAMWDVIIKNDGITDIEIEDIGISIDATSQVTISDFYTYDEISGSDDLRSEVNSGNLIVNNGTSDLDAANGVEYLLVVNVWYLEENYYNKTELQTSGQSEVHWDNLTDVPDFASTNWQIVRARALGFYGAAPSGVEGDFYVNTGDDHLYKYVSAAWVDQGLPSNQDKVVNLDATSENLYEYDSTSAQWVDLGIPGDNDSIILNDDGDSKPALYIYDENSGPDGQWLKVADADFLSEGNTLDEAYDQDGDGVGRSIDVDSGAVQLTASNGYAPLELTDSTAAPTVGLAGGQLSSVNGLLYAYDDIRGKWLSVQREILTFGRRGTTGNQWLNFGVGNLSSNNSGFRIPRNATITAMSVQLDAVGTCTVRLRRNDVSTNIFSLVLTAILGDHDNTVDVDLTEGDFLQARNRSTAGVEDPVVMVEIAWRV